MTFNNETYFNSNNTVKNLLFTCCLIAVALSQATAQVSKSDFNADINYLNTAITKNDARLLRGAFDGLNNKIANEITYRTSNMKTISIQAKQDSLEAVKELTQTKSDYDKAMAEPSGLTAQSRAKKNKDLQDAQNERAAAQAELKKASQDVQMLINNRDNLNIELKIRGDLTQLYTNIPANQNDINVDLRQFAATLQ